MGRRSSLTAAAAVGASVVLLMLGRGSATDNSAGSDVGGSSGSAVVDISAEASSTTTSAPLATTTTTSTTTTTTTTAPPEVALLSGLNLREKAAQLLMISVAGPDADNIADVIADAGIGGVFITAGQGNISSLNQVVQLNADLQRLSLDRSGVGVLIATDQEGGQVFKAVVEGTTSVPGARVFGRIDDPAITSAMSEVMGRELAALGVNIGLAPVADVSTVSNFLSRAGRSYGPDPGPVAEQVAAAVEGLQAGGVAATLKHYPGHGSTRTDSHFGLPVVDTDLSTLLERDLVPFEAGVDAGAKVVMLGHLVVPAIDPEGLPATFSPAIIGMLRSGFGGVIMTDDIGGMAAVFDIPERERVVRAIAAGADLVLGSRDPIGAIDAIVAAVADGTIPENRLEDAAERVLRLKVELGLLSPQLSDAETAAKTIGGPGSAKARALLVESCRSALGRAC